MKGAADGHGVTIHTGDSFLQPGTARDENG